jgi:hypothetical protein
MEDCEKQDLLIWVSDLLNNFHQLEIHAAKNGIKPARSKIFCIVWLRLNQELKDFQRKWDAAKPLAVDESSDCQSILEPIDIAYIRLTHSYLVIIKAILRAWKEPIFKILQNKKLPSKLVCTKTLSTVNNVCINHLLQYDCKVLYQCLQTFRDIQWDILLLEKSEILHLQHAYQALQSQYYYLGLVPLLPRLMQLKSKIFNLRYESISYSRHKQNTQILENFHLSWRSLSSEFDVFSKEWRNIILQATSNALHEIDRVLRKEYDILAVQYYSLLKSRLPFLLQDTPGHSQHQTLQSAEESSIIAYQSSSLSFENRKQWATH